MLPQTFRYMPNEHFYGSAFSNFALLLPPRFAELYICRSSLTSELKAPTLSD